MGKAAEMDLTTSDSMNEFVLFLVSQLDFGSPWPKEGGRSALSGHLTLLAELQGCFSLGLRAWSRGAAFASPDSLPSAPGSRLSGAPLLERAGILHVALRRAPGEGTQDFLEGHALNQQTSHLGVCPRDIRGDAKRHGRGVGRGEENRGSMEDFRAVKILRMAYALTRLPKPMGCTTPK